MDGTSTDLKPTGRGMPLGYAAMLEKGERMFVAEGNEFKVGDIAVSNKYGTRMTVTRVENDRVDCAWFNKNQEPFRELFVLGEVTAEKE